ncbi:hypothetical protein [Mariniblastus fucicola]|uniref:Uncharacterized protein n=1 Tax=Mariniblastus fucicola TaxID=980251 RepID=A0A5B9P8G1_9BACT|nr:hypothetical protein [Mariniblastus fucicola]QEG22568.1 hypothetical protein MFFC18_24510 [Mariniblastus fucicola]
MSFDYPQQPQPRKKGGMSGIMVLLFIGFVFFFVMRGGGSGSAPTSGEGVDQGDRHVEKRVSPRTDRVLQEEDKYRRQRAEVLGSEQKDGPDATPGRKMPSGSGNRNSDWSIEEVGGDKSAATAPKKTEGKDGWSIEEVPNKKDSGTGLKLKESGGKEVELKEGNDWSIEDVDPKKKKTSEGDWSLEEVGGEKGGK